MTIITHLLTICFEKQLLIPDGIMNTFITHNSFLYLIDRPEKNDKTTILRY